MSGPATEPAAGVRGRRGTRASWWLWSLGVHFLLFLVLWFSPARELVFERASDEQSRISADRKRVEEVAGQIDEMQKKLMLKKLERLDDIREEMGGIRKLREEDFSKFARDLAQQAPVTALAALEEAVRRQEQVLERFEPMEKAAAGMPAFDPPEKSRRVEEMTRAEAARLQEAEQRLERSKREHAEARAEEERANRALEELRRKPEVPANELGGAERKLAEARTAVEQRRNGEQQAETARREAGDALNAARRETDGKLEEQYRALRSQVSGLLEEARTGQREARNRELEAAEKIGFTDLPEAREAVEGAVAAQRQADAVLDRAETGFNETEATHRTLADAGRKLAEERTRADYHRNKVAGASGPQRETEQAELDKRLEALRQAEQRFADAGAADNAARGGTREARGQARASQQEAREAARRAIEVLRAAVAREAAVPLAAARVESVGEAPDTSRLSPSDSVQQVLSVAGGVEVNIAQTYRVVKAVEEAAMRQVPVAEALKKTRIALPDRTPPDLAPLDREARTSADVEARKKVYRAAQSQMSSAVSLAEQMLIEAKGEEDEMGMNIDYEGMKVAAARHRAYTAMALEDAGEKAKDMSGLMQGIDQPAADPAPAGGPAGRSPYPDLPESAVVEMPAGRRFTAQAGVAPVGGQWVSVNSWYCIGPFPNPNRREVDTRFPPDSVIDLDASYRGMDGKMIDWKFIRSPTPMVCPHDEREYGIYYFCTELWFDEPMDIWTAIGSDDNSRIWVDEKMIWLSAYELKSWRIDEGFRKVHFKRGFNKVMVRLENGWHTCGFSLLLHMGEGR